MPLDTRPPSDLSWHDWVAQTAIQDDVLVATAQGVSDRLLRALAPPPPPMEASLFECDAEGRTPLEAALAVHCWWGVQCLVEAGVLTDPQAPLTAERLLPISLEVSHPYAEPPSLLLRWVDACVATLAPETLPAVCRAVAEQSPDVACNGSSPLWQRLEAIGFDWQSPHPYGGTWWSQMVRGVEQHHATCEDPESGDAEARA